MCFQATRFVAKSKERCNLSSLAELYLLTKVNAFLGVEEMVQDKFPTNCQSKELSFTELTAAKTRETTWTQAKFVFSNRYSKRQCLTRLLWNLRNTRGMATNEIQHKYVTALISLINALRMYQLLLTPLWLTNRNNFQLGLCCQQAQGFFLREFCLFLLLVLQYA